MFRQAPSFPYHDLGIVEDGNTASRAISKDAFVIWKGASYFASTDILQGATLEEDVNLTAIPDGVINGVVEALNNNSGSEILYNGSIPSNGNNIALSDSIENYNGGIVIKLKTDAYGLGTLFIPKALIVYDTANTDYNVWEVPVFQGGAYGWLSCKIYDATHIHIHNKGNSGWGAPTNITVVGIH